MKKIFKFLFAGVLMSALCVGFMGCNEPQGPEPLYPEPGAVPFTEYSLSGKAGENTSARWINLDYSNSLNGKIIVINSKKELKKYVEGDYPPIDFSKKTLVLAYGYNSGIRVADGHTFQYVSGRTYAMTANLVLTLAAAMFEWQVAIVVDKLPSDSNIELNTKHLNLP